MKVPLEDNLSDTNDSTTEKNQSENLKLDKIISDYGHGWEIMKIVISAVMVYMVLGYTATIFASMVTAYKAEYHLTDPLISSIGLTYFICKAIGALFAGYIANNFSRTTIIFISLTVIFFTSVINGLVLRLSFLYLERFITGVLGGIMEPIINNMLCEFLPVKGRGFILLSVWTGYNLGYLFPNLIMLATMPKYQAHGIQATIISSSFLCLISFAFCFMFLKDSPRNYFLQGKEELGFNILEKMTKKRLSNNVKKFIVKETKEGANQEVSSGKFSEIFKGEYLVPTILISILSFISDLIYDGPVLIMDLTLQQTSRFKHGKNLLIEAIVISVITIPSAIVGGALMEVKTLGRTKTMFICYCFLIIALIPALLFINYMYIFFGLYLFFANFGSIMTAIYASEVFPTKIRDHSVGWSVFLSNIGSALSQFIFVALHESSLFAPYYFVIGCCLIGCVTTCFLTIETYQRPLDECDHQKKEKDANEKKCLL